MLTILRTLLDAMQAQARADHPLETCGIVAGPAGSNRPLRLVALRNAAQSADFFRFDSGEQLRVWRELDARGEEPVVYFHSHTHSSAYPSRDDIEHAAEAQAHYVIVSTGAAAGPAVRSFRIVNGKVVEEAIRAVDHYEGATPTAPAPSSSPSV